jgi:DNA-binding XRE family transcriptional regulator
MSHVVVEGAAPEFTLTDRLRKAREHGGLDQPELASLMGVSVRSIRNYEAGRTTPRRPQLIAWAFATGVSLEWLEADVRPKGLEPPTFWSVVARWAHKSRQSGAGAKPVSLAPETPRWRGQPATVHGTWITPALAGTDGAITDAITADLALTA